MKLVAVGGDCVSNLAHNRSVTQIFDNHVLELDWYEVPTESVSAFNQHLQLFLITSDQRIHKVDGLTSNFGVLLASALTLWNNVLDFGELIDAYLTK